MKTLAVLPARYASTRFPGKPLALIAGKPMIQWVWEAAQRAGVNTVVIATDDERIAAVVNDFDGRVVFTDPTLASGTDRVAAAMDKLGEEFDIVLNIQGDEPAMHHETIASVVDLMTKKPDLPMGTAACPFYTPDEIFNPNNVKVVLDNQNRALYFSRSAIPYLRSSTCFEMDFRSWMSTNQLSLFRRHLGIYAYRPHILKQFTLLSPHPLEQVEMLEQLRALAAGIAIGVAETPHCSLGVDTPADVAGAEEMLNARL
ncbi:MAG: 3-deoxy-manno-octulosonate cytidylyltransferase [Holophagales bacterium]|jgi:3-deoxy-manno-octulosonate cytidylyltransferase (CMP-KDO synthetase)|nr:3-deoxy-manno-octulosonate cytidylyltransferase [Holophagales bacterium]